MAEFIKNYGFTQYVKSCTRDCTKFYKAKNTNLTSSFLDVVIHNDNLIGKTLVADYPFSDHKYAVAVLEFKAAKPIEKSAMVRKLCLKNLETIKLTIENTDFSDINLRETDNDRWILAKEKLINIIYTSTIKTC